ncbi:TPA: RNA pyrophosphohydrolase, partial [Neisseria meningitidis]
MLEPCRLICQNRPICGKIVRLNLTEGDTVLDREGYRPNVG